MQLTRRDALTALAAAGVVGTGAAVMERDSPPENPLDADDIDTLVALARVLYPSEVTGVRAFVERYSLGRTTERDAYRRGIADAVGELDGYAGSWYGARYAELDEGTQNKLLQEIGVPTADPDRRGRPPERIRYYLVNELLYALYTTPTGGELVGIENPQGHPGGLATYRRGPSDE